MIPYLTSLNFLNSVGFRIVDAQVRQIIAEAIRQVPQLTYLLIRRVDLIPAFSVLLPDNETTAYTVVLVTAGSESGPEYPYVIGQINIDAQFEKSFSRREFLATLP